MFHCSTKNQIIDNIFTPCNTKLMPNKELQNFIKESTKAGLGLIEIRNKLLEAGWPGEKVEEALNQQLSPTEQLTAAPQLKTSLSSGFSTSLPSTQPVVPEISVSSPAPQSETENSANQAPAQTEAISSPPQQNHNSNQVAISIERITDPNRLLAFPFIGPLIKLLILIPIFLEAFFLSLYWLIISSINAFVILVNGQYLPTAYQFNVKFFQFQTKIVFYLFGLTNKYPGFSLDINDKYSINIPQPISPNRVFAIPVLGLIGRYILLYPYMMFTSFIQLPAMSAFFLIAWVPILFKKSYPASIFEMIRDGQILSLRYSAFLMGIDDNYPDFSVSWNYRTKKYLMIVLPLVIIYLFYFMSAILMTINPVAQINKANNLKTISPSGTPTSSFYATPTPDYQINPTPTKETSATPTNLNDTDNSPDQLYLSPDRQSTSSPASPSNLGKLVIPTADPLNRP